VNPLPTINLRHDDDDDDDVAELEDPDVRAYVGVHEQYVRGAGADRQGWRTKGTWNELSPNDTELSYAF